MIIKSILGDKILVNWREIKDLQPKGSKNVENLEDLKKSILSNSFASPFIGWQDKKGDYYAIDGHTRKQALIELIEEGHSVPDLLDLQIILAGGRKEAIKILAEVYNQKQNKFKSDVLIEWLESEGVEVDTDSMNIDWVDDGDGNDNDVYTSKIESPIYVPKGVKPKLDDLVDLEKYKKLIEEIDNKNIDSLEKDFLKLAAARHMEFDYGLIAEYYCHSNSEVKELIENSALVIVDYNKAIEMGFVELFNTLEVLSENDR